ncbi:hypothetical protein P5U49_000855 [Neisseria gonorrhoeae]
MKEFEVKPLSKNESLYSTVEDIRYIADILEKYKSVLEPEEIEQLSAKFKSIDTNIGGNSYYLWDSAMSIGLDFHEAVIDYNEDVFNTDIDEDILSTLEKHGLIPNRREWYAEISGYTSEYQTLADHFGEVDRHIKEQLIEALNKAIDLGIYPPEILDGIEAEESGFSL